MPVTLERLVLEDFKSFRGRVDVPIGSSARNNGSLICVVGPNGSGKSTISDALTFCFGEKDMRAKSLGDLINEEAALAGASEASVAVDLRRSEDGAVLRITRAVTVLGGKATSDYSVETLVPEGSAPSTEPRRAPKILSRSALTERLRALGVNLDLVDSFICKQQGSTLASLSGLALLQFIERLVGTWVLAEEIEARGKVAVVETDAAMAFEVILTTVRHERRALAPARAAFENYRLEQAAFVYDLAAFAKKEKRLYAQQRAAADQVDARAAVALTDAEERARPAAAAAAYSKAQLAAAQKTAAKVRTLERNRARAVADEEEKLAAAAADAKAKKRRLEAALKRAALAAIEAQTAEATSALAQDQAETSEAPYVEASASLAAARETLNTLLTSSNSCFGSAAHRQKQLLQLSNRLRASTAAFARAIVERDEKKAQLKILSEAAHSAEAHAKILDESIAATSGELTAARLKQEAAAEVALEASEREEVAQSELASATAATRRCATDLANEHARGASRSASDNLRRTAAPLIARLVSSAGGGTKPTATIHGWLNELAWAREGYSTSLNAALKSALTNVVVVGSRSDGLKLVDACRSARIGPITCDVLDELSCQGQQHGTDPRNPSVGGKDLPALIDFLEFADDRYRAVFAARLRNWFVAADEAAALAATSRALEVRGCAPPNVVTLSGDIFMGDGELRTTVQGRSKRGNEATTLGSDLRVRAANDVTLVASAEEQQEPRTTKSKEDLSRALKEAEKREKAAVETVSKASAARRDKEQNIREIKSSTSTLAAEVLSKKEDAIRADRVAKSARKQADSKRADLSAVEEGATLAAQDQAEARADLSTAAGGGGDKDVDAWLSQVDASRSAVDSAERKISIDESGRRSAAAAVKRAEKTKLRLVQKVTDCDVSAASAASDHAAALDTVASVDSRLKELLALLEEAKNCLSMPAAELEACQERVLEKEREADLSREQLELALKAQHEAAASSKALDTWSKAIVARDAEIAAQMSTKAVPSRGGRKSDADNDMLTESSDDNEDVAMSAQKKHPNILNVLDGSSSDESGDKVPLNLRRCGKYNKNAVPEASTAKSSTTKHNGIGDVRGYKEQLDVARAGLRLSQVALQKSEDSVDISAVEQDLQLATQETSLQANSSAARRRASDALHQKAILEQERFDRLFGSLERINVAFGEAYAELSLEGEADLRYSREPLTLYEEGVAAYAKPARSSWRLAASLSGGQQATVGLALIFGFQFVYKSPFYLLDEVDASLDAQHAARAGSLMKQRAATENVQYIAISHRPQLYLHADRMVGTYGKPRGASLCMAADFPSIDFGGADNEPDH